MIVGKVTSPLEQEVGVAAYQYTTNYRSEGATPYVFPGPVGQLKG